MAKRTYAYQPDYAVPPGYVLEEHLEARGLTPAEFAHKYSLSPELIEGVMHGSAPIDADLAAIFGREFNLAASVWLKMEAIYRRRLEQIVPTIGASYQKRAETMATHTIKRIVCLANSRKLSGRCIAGKEIQDNGQIGRWVRPVSARETEEVSEWERQYEDGSDPRLLDIIDVPLLNAKPKDFQQENWLLDPEYYWEKVRPVTEEELRRCIDPAARLWTDGYSTTNGWNDRIPLRIAHSLTDSLRFIEVGDLELWVSHGNKRRTVQGRFQHDGIDYWLRVTDPVYEREYLRQPNGNYPVGECYLTVSLGEPFEGNAYKLIAAIIKP